MPSSVVTAFQQAIREKKVARKDPDLALVAHSIAQALALTPDELGQVTAAVRAGIVRGAIKVSVPHDRTGTIDETKLPPLPKLPPVAIHPQRPGIAVSKRLVARLIATCERMTAKEVTLVTQGVRAGLAARKK